jgi:predicted dinucleotide-binding enzyme
VYRSKEFGMNIAIIGAGNIGGILTRGLTAIGHHVSVANSRGPDTLAGLAAETGAVPMAITEVADGADVVIVAVPEKSILDLPPGILPDSAVVIDTGNYVPHLRDGQIDELDNGTVESRWAESHLRHPVVKAFNTITARPLATLGRPAGAPGRIALPVAGDDPAAKSTVIELASQLGFDGIDAGGLDDSWRQQPGTPVFTTDLDATAARKALADASPRQTQAWRARAAASRPA